MPRPIKKRKKKKEITEERVFSVFETLQNYYENNRRFVHLLAILAVGLILVISFSIYYLKNRTQKAYTLTYEGYKYYYRLYDASSLPDDEALKRALEKFQEAYKNRPQARSLYYIALIQMRKGRYDDALKNFKTLVKKFSREEEFLSLGLYNIAQIQLKQGNREAALKTLDELYSTAKGYFKDLALFESARILEETGKKEEAQRKYSLIVEKYPSSPFYSIASSKIEKKKDKEKKK